MRTVLLQAQLGGTQQSLLRLDAVLQGVKHQLDVGKSLHQRCAELYTHVLLHLPRHTHGDLHAILHQYSVVPYILHILLVIAAILFVHTLVERRQIAGLHGFWRQSLAVFLHQNRQRLTVKGLIPRVAVVLKHRILPLRLVSRSLHRHSVIILRHPDGQLIVALAGEAFTVQRICAACYGPCLIEALQLLEVKAWVMQSIDDGLHLTFLIHDADGVDALVHANGVLPVVGTAGIFGVILDAHGL